MKLNFKKMKDMGMEKIIFSKDNTLTLPGKSNFIDEQVQVDQSSSDKEGESQVQGEQQRQDRHRGNSCPGEQRRHRPGSALKLEQDRTSHSTPA